MSELERNTGVPSDAENRFLLEAILVLGDQRANGGFRSLCFGVNQVENVRGFAGDFSAR